MAKTPLLVPVCLAGGGMLHDTDYACGADDVEAAAHLDNMCFDKTGHMRWGADYVWSEIAPFTARLRVVDVGAKPAYVWLVDADTLDRYPMFTSDYVALMNGPISVVDGWIELMTYEVCKKGTAYGIRSVK